MATVGTTMFFEAERLAKQKLASAEVKYEVQLNSVALASSTGINEGSCGDMTRSDPNGYPADLTL